MSEPEPPKHVHISYRGTNDPRAVREAVFAAAYQALTGRPAEEFTRPRGWYVAEMVVRDPDGNPEVWARWTTEHPGRTGPALLLDPTFREKLRRAGWHVSYLSPGAPLEPLTGRPSAPRRRQRPLGCTG